MKYKTFSKGFFWAVAIATGSCAYVALFALAIPQIGKTPYSGSFLASCVAHIVFWPTLVMPYLPEWFSESLLGTLLVLIWLLAAGPGLFISLWTWCFINAVRWRTGARTGGERGGGIHY